MFLVILACKSDDITMRDDDPVGGDFEMVDVKVMLPEDTSINLNSTTILSLGNSESLDENTTGAIPFNSGTVEIAYLLDADNNVLLAGFISDDRKEISVTTTAELMVYYALDYYLLPDQAKSVFLDNVSQANGFNTFVSAIEGLFIQNSLMYADGDYIQALQNLLNQVSTQKNPGQIDRRIFFNDEATKSGVTLSTIDSTNIQLQNALPRRSRAVIYKKSFRDREGTVQEIPNYTDTVFEDFTLETGKINSIQEIEVGSALSQINTQLASIDNASTTGPILLPVNPTTEFAAEYEVTIIGSGLPNNDAREMTTSEREKYITLNKETYILDYFLPTLLDIGGNKSLLPPFGSDKDVALVNAVLPILEQNTEVLEQVENNEFKVATNLFLPELYTNIGISSNLRNILRDVYNIITNNGDSPEQFIFSQELDETGFARTEQILRTIDQNIKANNQSANFAGLRTTAFNFETWVVRSIDAVVEFQRDDIELCLGDAVELRVTAMTEFEPEVEEFEFHWTTSNQFGGRVQDIEDDPNNFGSSIITSGNVVSYISTALESDLGDGDNIETITVTLFFKNKETGELTEAGSDTITINNLKTCVSFTVPIVRQPNLREQSSITCANGISYQAFSPVPYRAEFEAVEGAIAYRGRITRSDGVVGSEMTLNVGELDNDLLGFSFGIGSFSIFNSCNQAQSEEQAQQFVDAITNEPVSIEIMPVFN